MAGTLTQALKLTTHLDPSGLNALGSHMDQLDSHAEKTSGLFSKLGTVVKVGLLAGGAGAIAGIGASIKLAGDFEQQINNIGASTGASTEELKKLHDAALQVGKDTPKSASEAAEAFGELARAGISANDIVAGVGRTAVDFAVSQGAAIPAMANLLTSGLTTFKSTLVGFGDASAQAEHVASVLAASASSSAIGIDDIAFSLSAVGPVAAQAGLTIDDFGAAIGLLGNNALKGSDAGTSLKTMLLNLMAPTSTAAGMMDQLGINVRDAQGHMLPFRDIIGVLQEKMGGLADDERDMAMRTIFGTDAIRAGNIILKEGTKGWDAFNDKLKEAPTLVQQRDARMKGLNGQIEQLKGSLETAAIIIGEKFLPGLAAIAEGATGVINKLIEGDWSGAARMIGEGLLSGLTAIRDFGGRLLGWLGEQLSSIDWGAVWGGVQDIGAAIWAGLRAVGGGVVEIAGWVADRFAAIDWGALWQGIQDLGSLIWRGLRAVGGGLAELGGWIGDQFAAVDWGAVWGQVQDIGTRIWDGLVAAAGAGAAGAEQLAGWIGAAVKGVDWKNVFSGGGDLARGMGDAVRDGVAGVQSALSGLQRTAGKDGGIAGWLKADLVGGFSDLLDKLRPSQAAIDGVSHAFDRLGVAAGPFLQAVGRLLEGLKPLGELLVGIAAIGIDLGLKLAKYVVPSVNDVARIFGHVIDIITDTMNIFTDMVNLVDDLVHGQWSKAWDDAQRLVGDTFTLLGDQLGLLWDIVSRPFNQVIAFLGDVWGQAQQYILAPITGALGALGDAGSGALGAIWSAITGAFHGIWQWFQDHWVDVLGTVMLGPFFLFRDELGDAAKGLLGTIWSNITNAFAGILSWFRTTWNELKDHALAPFQWLLNNGGSAVAGVAKVLLTPFHEVLAGLDAFGSGIRGALNWVLNDALHLGLSIPNPPHLADLIPGYAAGTSFHRGGLAIVGEAGPELVSLPEGAAVLPAPETAALREQGAIPGFLFGLDPGKVLDTLKGAWGAIAGFATEWLGKGAEALVQHALTQFGVTGDFAGNFLGLPGAVFTLVKDAIVEGVKELLGLADKAKPAQIVVNGTPVNLPGEVTDWLQQAARIALGRDLTGPELTALLWLVAQESGGNPNAVNPNAVISGGANYGHATGLLQTIPSTFAANALPGHTNILNPVDNAIAAMRYILATYGDLTIPAAREQAGAPGYAQGGIVHSRTLAWVGENGPEAIIPLTGIAHLATGTPGPWNTQPNNAALWGLAEFIVDGIQQAQAQNPLLQQLAAAVHDQTVQTVAAIGVLSTQTDGLGSILAAIDSHSVTTYEAVDLLRQYAATTGDQRAAEMVRQLENLDDPGLATIRSGIAALLPPTQAQAAAAASLGAILTAIDSHSVAGYQAVELLRRYAETTGDQRALATVRALENLDDPGLSTIRERVAALLSPAATTAEAVERTAANTAKSDTALTGLVGDTSEIAKATYSIESYVGRWLEAIYNRLPTPSEGLASGTGSWPGGWAWVGEEGPELAYLPHGAAVLPNPLAMALAGGARFPGLAGGTPAQQGQLATLMQQANHFYEMELATLQTIAASLGITNTRLDRQSGQLLDSNGKIVLSLNAVQGLIFDGNGKIVASVDSGTAKQYTALADQIFELQFQGVSLEATQVNTAGTRDAVLSGNAALQQRIAVLAEQYNMNLAYLQGMLASGQAVQQSFVDQVTAEGKQLASLEATQVNTAGTRDAVLRGNAGFQQHIAVLAEQYNMNLAYLQGMLASGQAVQQSFVDQVTAEGQQLAQLQTLAGTVGVGGMASRITNTGELGRAVAVATSDQTAFFGPTPEQLQVLLHGFTGKTGTGVGTGGSSGDKPPGGLSGFAAGGIVTEPVLGTGQRSGRQYQFGEAGPEVVTPVGRDTKLDVALTDAAPLAPVVALAETMLPVSAGDWLSLPVNLAAVADGATSQAAQLKLLATQTPPGLAAIADAVAAGTAVVAPALAAITNAVAAVPAVQAPALAAISDAVAAGTTVQLDGFDLLGGLNQDLVAGNVYLSQTAGASLNEAVHSTSLLGGVQELSSQQVGQLDTSITVQDASRLLNTGVVINTSKLIEILSGGRVKGVTPDDIRGYGQPQTGYFGPPPSTGNGAKPPGTGTGFGGGFAAGGLLREPVAGRGAWSGRRYTFAETGPEWFGGVGQRPAPTVYQFGDVQMVVPVDQVQKFNDVVDVFDRIVQTARARGLG